MKINGRHHELDCVTVREMLEKLGFDEKYVVVEVNENIVSKNDYESHVLKKDDSVEVISFVGGG